MDGGHAGLWFEAERLRDGEVERDQGDFGHGGTSGGKGFVGGGAGGDEVVGGGDGGEAVVGGRVGDEDSCAAKGYGERRRGVAIVGTTTTNGECCRRGSGGCSSLLLMMMMRLRWEGSVYGADLWYGVDDLSWYGCFKGVVEGDDVVP